MELQEAINHAREVAEGCAAGNKECAYQHDKLADWLEELRAVKDILGNDYDLDRLRELVEADRDGRCVVLPDVKKKDRESFLDALSEAVSSWGDMSNGEKELANSMLAALSGEISTDNSTQK